MLGFFKKKKIEPQKYCLGAVVTGKSIAMQEVNDKTFSQELLGKGVAVVPTDGTVYAPEDAVVEMVFETKHAVSLKTSYNAEILIHFGIDTINLKGEGFESLVQAGDKVKRGDRLLQVDVPKLLEKGYDATVVTIICNTEDFANVEAIVDKDVVHGEDNLNIETI